MRWPRPRFKVRRLMIAVAIVALSLGGIFWVAEMRARSMNYHRRARKFAAETARLEPAHFMTDGRVMDHWEDENDRIKDAWARQMADKYWHLSNYPWLAVEPDPPRPVLLAHPRRGFELLPDQEKLAWQRRCRHPAWTFLWTWHR